MATRMKPPAAPPPDGSKAQRVPQRERKPRFRQPCCINQQAANLPRHYHPPSKSSNQPTPTRPHLWLCPTHPAYTAQSTCPQGPPPGCPAAANMDQHNNQSHSRAAAAYMCKLHLPAGQMTSACCRPSAALPSCTQSAPSQTKSNLTALPQQFTQHPSQTPPSCRCRRPPRWMWRSARRWPPWAGTA